MKTRFKVRFKSGLMGESIVVAKDAEDARREAFSLCKYTTACVPENYGIDDVVASVEPAGDIPSGKAGYGGRPVSEIEIRGDYEYGNSSKR